MPSTDDTAPIARAVVTSQATHLPLVAQPPALQLADAIGDEVVAAKSGASVSVSIAEPSTAGRSMVRTLSLMLAPTHLGTLNVEMRLVAGRLELTIEATRPETARSIEQDKATLSDALGAIGISLDDVVVRAGSGDARPADGGTNGSSQSFNQSAARHDGSAAPGGGSSRNDAQGDGRRDAPRIAVPERPRTGDRPSPAGTARSDRFV